MPGLHSHLRRALCAAPLALCRLPGHAAPGTQEVTSGAGVTTLNLFIPGNAMGGWDQTGRALGDTLLTSKLAGSVGYENKGGRGGVPGLAEFLQRHARNPNALLISGLVMVGALAMERQMQALMQLTPIARLTSDTMVLCAAPGSGITQLSELVKAWRSDLPGTPVAGGSAGGVDHMLAAMVVRSIGGDVRALNYLPSGGGAETLQHLRSGRARVAISGYSEFRAEIDAGQLVPLAVSSRRAQFGIPSLREKGVDTELSNWRGVFASAALEPAQKTQLGRLVRAAVQTPQWAQAVARHNWVAAPMYGKDFEQFVEVEQAIATVVTSLLKLQR